MPSGREFVKVFEDVLKYILGPDKALQLSDIVRINPLRPITSFLHVFKPN